MNKCTWDETGLKPCEMQALDCSSCDYHQEEQTMLKCINCYHYKACFSFSPILAPLNGGVICEEFINTSDVVEVKHGTWLPYGYKWTCSVCKGKANIDGTPIQNGLYYCPNCGAKMDGE